MSAMNRVPIIMDREPELSEVAADDKTLIRNIVYAVMALNKTDPFCRGWQVQCVPQGYIVLIFLNPTFAISVHDLLALRELNVARITNVVITCSDAVHAADADPPAAGDRAAAEAAHGRSVLRIQVLNGKQPVVFYDTDVVRVRKRARTWF